MMIVLSSPSLHELSNVSICTHDSSHYSRLDWQSDFRLREVGDVQLGKRTPQGVKVHATVWFLLPVPVFIVSTPCPYEDSFGTLMFLTHHVSAVTTHLIDTWWVQDVVEIPGLLTYATSL